MYRQPCNLHPDTNHPGLDEKDQSLMSSWNKVHYIRTRIYIYYTWDSTFMRHEAPFTEPAETKQLNWMQAEEPAAGGTIALTGAKMALK